MLLTPYNLNDKQKAQSPKQASADYPVRPAGKVHRQPNPGPARQVPACVPSGRSQPETPAGKASPGRSQPGGLTRQATARQVPTGSSPAAPSPPGPSPQVQPGRSQPAPSPAVPAGGPSPEPQPAGPSPRPNPEVPARQAQPGGLTRQVPARQAHPEHIGSPCRQSCSEATARSPYPQSSPSSSPQALRMLRPEVPARQVAGDEAPTMIIQ